MVERQREPLDKIYKNSTNKTKSHGDFSGSMRMHVPGRKINVFSNLLEYILGEKIFCKYIHQAFENT